MTSTTPFKPIALPGVHRTSRPAAPNVQAMLIAAILLLLLWASIAQAHLMVAQRGTLNILDRSAYMVISLPLSAFGDLDDDGNGHVSTEEFAAHRPEIETAVREGITLFDEVGVAPLGQVLLSPEASHSRRQSTVESVAGLTVMGRFQLRKPDSTLQFRVALFGTRPAERRLTITATRAQDKEKRVFDLRPDAPQQMVFVTADSV